MWDASKCDFCGDCLVKCLYVDYDKDRAVAEIKALMEGEEAEILSKCITCCACREYCPTGADPYDLICEMQARTGASPITEAVVAVMDKSFEAPSELIPGDPDKPVLSLCVMEFGTPQGTLDGQLFEGMTVVKGAGYFCYEGYVHAGAARGGLLEKGVQKFIDKMAGLCKDIVFLHDECYAMAHVIVKEYGVTVPFKYMHIFEYLRDYLRDNQSGITKLGKKVAYQRPCSSRYTPEKDVLLDEIFELIGVERPPRKYDRETALCCSGHAIRHAFPELSAEIQAKNINDAIECSADAMVTLCPMCNRQLRRVTSDHGLNKIFITDLCRMALGEKPFPQ
ncbi:MAG TPA: (Fe-S)-binding protein [Dehalococcoidia bacterium]|nr:(Fe-S)-binding protein [Dehalococcoidia bacterium]